MMVSVYCLTYNHGKYIRDALEGFVMQETTFDYEVFVHDDHSSDNTVEIIREYAERYPGIIKPIYQVENQHSKGKNIFLTYLLPCFSGRYIAVCEGDDCWTSKYKLQKQVAFLESNPEYIGVFANVEVVDENDRPVRNALFSECLPAHEVTFKDYQNGGYNPIGQYSSLVHRNYFADWSEDRLNMRNIFKGNGDVLRSFELMAEGRVYFMKETFSKYRCVTSHGESWSARTWRQNINQFQYFDKKTLFQYAEAAYSMVLWHDSKTIETLFFCISSAYKWALKKHRRIDFEIACELTWDYLCLYGFFGYLFQFFKRAGQVLKSRLTVGFNKSRDI